MKVFQKMPSPKETPWDLAVLDEERLLLDYSVLLVTQNFIQSTPLRKGIGENFETHSPTLNSRDYHSLWIIHTWDFSDGSG